MFGSAPAPNQIRVPEGNIYADPASNFASRVKVGHDTYSRPTPSFSPQDSSSATTKGEVNPAHWAPPGSWPEEAVRSTTKANTLLTWAPSKAKNGMPIITRGEGVKLYDTNEKEYIDWTSQAVCANLGHTIPSDIKEAINIQLDEIPFVYGGMGLVEIRARLSALIGEIMPAGISGVVFPSSGSEANECAIAMARRFTGRTKIISAYRSYHGGTAASSAATGDFRRHFLPAAPDFVKMFQPNMLFSKMGGLTEPEKVENALTLLEEQIIFEGGENVASIIVESIPGAAGVLTYPDGYLQGVRALCDRYGIVMHCDEIMVGFGRTGRMWGFQHYDGVVPDIVTSAKGLSAGFVPVSVVACNDEMKEFFEEAPLGWGSTYQAHPVALAASYATIKHMLEHDIVGMCAKKAPQFASHMERLTQKHPCLKQFRSVGLFGAFDVVAPDGQQPQMFHDARGEAFVKYYKAFNDEGLYGLLRPPLLHVAPPLVITEEEMAEGFERHDRALNVLDKELGF